MLVDVRVWRVSGPLTSGRATSLGVSATAGASVGVVVVGVGWVTTWVGLGVQAASSSAAASSRPNRRIMAVGFIEVLRDEK